MFARRLVIGLVVAAVLVGVRSAGAQSPPYGSISPGPGTYDAGTQLQVHVELCSPSSFFDSWGTVSLNGVTIGSTQPGSHPSCADFQSGDFTITIAEGANTVSAQASDQYGTAYVEETYTGTAPPPPPPPLPMVSLAPHNPGSLLGGFDVVFAHGTPAYFSLGTARGVTVAYNSATVQPTPVIFFDVTNAPGSSPTGYSVQVRRAGNNSLLDLLNGSQTVYYTAGTQTLRLAAAFDAQANLLGTGWHDLTVTVTAQLAGGPQSRTVATRVLVVDQTASAFGKGADMVGLQRVRTMPGTYSVMITEGDGSAAFFANNGECPTCSTFTSPAGEASTLTKVTDDSLGPIYRRRYLDGAIVDFTNEGRMLRTAGIFGDTTTFLWTDTLLTQIRDPMGKTLTLAYTGGRLQTVTDPAGRVTTYEYDGSGRLFRVTDPDSVATTLAYNASHLLTGVTDRGGAVTSFTYDPLRRVDTTYAPMIQIYTGANVRPRTVVTAPERIVWQPGTPGTSAGTAKLSVRPDTLFAVAVGPNGAVVKSAFDRFGSPTKLIGPYGETTTITRDTLGRVRVTTEPNGHVMRLSYVSDGYLVGEAKDSTTGRVVSYTYGSNATLKKIAGDVTQLDVVYHDGTRGPLLAIDSVLGANRLIIHSVHRPDSLGRDTLIADGGQHETRVTYDTIWGNVLVTTAPDGSITRVHYDGAGRPDSVFTPTPPWSNVFWVYQYDVLNRVKEVRDPHGQITQYLYGPTTLDRVIDPKGQVYKVAYNALGMVVARHDLADTLMADTLKYDNAGNVRSVRTRRGDVITMTYDLVGRLLSRSGPDFPVDSFKYDPVGRWAVAWNTHQRDSAAFDQAGRLAATRQVFGGAAYDFAYTYDIMDRLRLRSAPVGGNPARYAYSAASGVLDTLCGAGACVAFKRNGETLRDTMIYNPGGAGSWKRLRAYDSLHAVARDSFSVVGLDTLFGGAWSYVRGRLKSENGTSTGSGTSPRYTYDAIGRLIDACDQQASLICENEYGENSLGVAGTVSNPAYAYDPGGNRTDSDANAVIGPGNRVTSFRGYTVGYDANGNVTSKTGNGAAFTYTWDALGRLTAVRNGGALLASYTYDALGRRVSSIAPDWTQEWYVYDQDHVMLDVNGGHAIKTEYGYAPGADRVLAVRHAQAPSWTGVVLTDPVIGTVRGIANLSGGALRKTYALTAWGQTAADTGVVTRFRMAGREYDQVTGLYYMRARYYDPELGRFLTEDPLGIAGGLNLYAYAGNDPVNRRDPSGLCHDESEEEEPSGDSSDPPKPKDPLIAESGPALSASCGGGPSPCVILGNCPGQQPREPGGGPGVQGSGSRNPPSPPKPAFPSRSVRISRALCLLCIDLSGKLRFRAPPTWSAPIATMAAEVPPTPVSGVSAAEAPSVSPSRTTAVAPPNSAGAIRAQRVAPARPGSFLRPGVFHPALFLLSLPSFLRAWDEANNPCKYDRTLPYCA